VDVFDDYLLNEFGKPFVDIVLTVLDFILTLKKEAVLINIGLYRIVLERGIHKLVDVI